MRRVAGVNESDLLSKMAAQIELMNKRLEGMTMNANVNQIGQFCDQCSGQHAYRMCPFVDVNSLPMEQAQVVRSFPRPNIPYLNSYNPRWRNHPNFS